MRFTILSAVLTLSSLQIATAGNYMPIAPGNNWHYRSSMSGETLVVQVGQVGYMMGGQVYYKLRGYTPQELFVRASESGDLYYFDEELDRELLLTSFQPTSNFWFHAPQRICEQEFQPQLKRVDYQGPAGSYNNSALLLHYRSFACADAGVEEERYAENVGMVRRVSTTIAGPVTYELVRASVGPLAISERPSVSFSVNLRQLPDRLIANLHLDVSGGSPVRLVFPSAQEYEVVLRDSSGQQIWRWSDGLAFAQAVHKKL